MRDIYGMVLEVVLSTVSTLMASIGVTADNTVCVTEQTNQFYHYLCIHSIVTTQ